MRNFLKITAGVAIFLALYSLAALLGDVLAWFLTAASPVLVPAMLIGFIPATIYMVHQLAKKHL